ncbi:hypothetical protein B9Z65_5734 [Elsinoe australis]|uniref:Uncharacterized protein n=1 Tax=Elsinoe australis TaxID=40998 RepID=A0A2P7YIZ9_9PEZI|nr:hypothetical protein B9Z65_5734 [Elsinoe australis]
MATIAPLISPFLLQQSLLATSSIPLTTALLAKLTTYAPPLLKSLAAKSSLSTAMLYRLLATHVKNARITPVATYLAYKSSGYADTGPISGITISDFVSVWTPYNTGGPNGAPGAGRKGTKNGGEEGKAGAQGQAVRGKLEERKSTEQLGVKERAGAVKRVMAEDLKVGVTLGGTREGTGMVVLEREGRENL